MWWSLSQKSETAGEVFKIVCDKKETGKYACSVNNYSSQNVFRVNFALFRVSDILQVRDSKITI